MLFGNRSELWWDHPIASSFDWQRVVWGIPDDQFRHTKDMIVEMLGLGVVAKRQMTEFLKELNHLRGTTVRVTGHDKDDLEEMAKRIMLISSGKLASDDSFSQLRHHTGTVCRTTLTADSYAPVLGLGRSDSSGSGLYEYEVNTAETSPQDVWVE